MKKLLLIPVMVTLLCGFACHSTTQQPLEQTARDGIAAAKGYLDSAKKQHPECVPSDNPAVGVCLILNRATGAKDTVADALNTYCASPAYSVGGGPCIPDKELAPKLQDALNNLNQTLSDVKAIGGK